jgi:DNA mismatch repair protein MutH
VEREEAVARLRQLEGEDLVKLATKFGVTVWKGEKINKGWAGHTIERYLGLPLNSTQAPNFGSWELKIVPLKYRRDGTLAVKETMAITMIDPVNVAEKPFEDSHLLLKLRKAVVCSRIFESKSETSSRLYRVSTFDLSVPEIFEQVRQDYEDVRRTIRRSGFEALSGSMGVLVQPRTKGAGHGSTSRAFYARTAFVAHILGL